jgi:hypothetical protein
MVVRNLFVLAFAFLLFTITADAENKCSAKGVMSGLDFSMNHCAVALYDEKSVTLWFSSTPITPEELQQFQLSSYADSFHKDAAGKRRSMITVAFCPGGGKPVSAPGEVKSAEIAFKHESADFLGSQEQWVLNFPKDKEMKIEKLTGELKPGGTLAGKITGALTSDGKKFAWDIDFVMTLPDKAAAAGPGCGD